MTYKELINPKLAKKPVFYENHAHILNQTLLENSVMSQYLNENMLQFFNDIGDIADCMDVYSEMDGNLSKIEYQYGYSQALDEVKNLNALVESMAITEFNMHGYDEKGGGNKRHMF